MTTLNTIIEEEKADTEKEMRKVMPEKGYTPEQINSWVETVHGAITHTMQRAYEAGEREADAKWEREVELLRTIPEHSSECLINEFPEHCDCDNYVNSNRTLDTLLSKIRS